MEGLKKKLMTKIIGQQLFSYYFRHIQTLEHYAYIIILIILIKKIGNVKGGIVGTTVLQVDQPHFTGVRHHLDFDHPCLTIISPIITIIQIGRWSHDRNRIVS